jgi:hypothetical protein
VVVFEVLSENCLEFGDELANGLVGSFPWIVPSQTTWTQSGGNPLVRDRDERAKSSSTAMSAMFTIMKMFYSRQDSYNSCMLELMRTQAAQRRL